MSSKIKILNTDLVKLAVLNAVSSAARAEKINADNTLAFSLPIKKAESAYIEAGTIYELDGDYFDTAYYKKEQQSNGRLMVSVEAEHVSYRLNNKVYNVEYFTEYGTPDYILGKILQGTGFSLGIVEFSGNTTFSLQEPASRRALLMQFVAYVGGELEFDGFTISVLAQRGSASPKALTVGKDITVISKAVDRRNFDDAGNPIIAYTCGVYKGATINLGDVVTLDYEVLDIDVSLRVVSKTYDPYNPNNVAIEIGNYVNALEDDLYRIETQSVSKDALMNGVRIGPEYGFEAVRNDKKARAYFKSDGMAFQAGDGSGDNWEDKLYYDFDSDTGEAVLVFDGLLSAQVIQALEGQFDITISNTIITETISAEKGNIAELTVDQLDTSDKVQNYLSGDKSDVNYIRIYDQSFEFVTAETDGSLVEQITDRNGRNVYWVDDTHVGITTEETDYPVMAYVYEEQVKLRIFFEQDGSQGYYTPKMVWGVGSTGAGDNGKGFILKDGQGLVLRYVTSAGQTHEIRVGEQGIIGLGSAITNIDIYANGMVTTYNDSSEYDWLFTKDSSGRITLIKNETTGDNTAVSWNAGNKP